MGKGLNKKVFSGIFISVVLIIILVSFILPWFNNLFEKNILLSPPIISNLQPSAYKTNDSINLLKKGDKYYLDRNYTIISEVPSYLSGGKIILTKNDLLSQTTFSINKNVRVYLAWDMREAIPSGWGKSTLPNISVSDSGASRIGQLKLIFKDFNAGNVVVPKRNSALYSNYIIFVKETTAVVPISTGSIANPGFETALSPTTDWSISSSMNVSVDSSQKHSGLKSLKISGRGYSIQKPNVLKGADGKRFTLTLWAKNNSALKITNKVGVQGSQTGSGLVMESSINFAGISSEWKQFSSTFTLPFNDADVDYRVLLATEPANRGTIWFDDINLVEASPIHGSIFATWNDNSAHLLTNAIDGLPNSFYMACPTNGINSKYNKTDIWYNISEVNIAKTTGFNILNLSFVSPCARNTECYPAAPSCKFDVYASNRSDGDWTKIFTLNKANCGTADAEQALNLPSIIHAKYLKISFNQVGDGNGWCLGLKEIRLFNSAPSVSALWNDNSTHPINLAIDGNLNTYYSSCSKPNTKYNSGYLLYDLGILKNFNTLNFSFGYPGKVDYPGAAPCSYDVYISQNKLNWEKVYSRGGNCSYPGTGRSNPNTKNITDLYLQFASLKSARYINLTYNAIYDGTGWCLSVKEINVSTQNVVVQKKIVNLTYMEVVDSHCDGYIATRCYVSDSTNSLVVNSNIPNSNILDESLEDSSRAESKYYYKKLSVNKSLIGNYDVNCILNWTKTNSDLNAPTIFVNYSKTAKINLVKCPETIVVTPTTLILEAENAYSNENVLTNSRCSDNSLIIKNLSGTTLFETNLDRAKGTDLQRFVINLPQLSNLKNLKIYAGGGCCLNKNALGICTGGSLNVKLDKVSVGGANNLTLNKFFKNNEGSLILDKNTNGIWSEEAKICTEDDEDDSGLNQYEFGTTSNNSNSFEDVCVLYNPSRNTINSTIENCTGNNCYIWEYYCDSDYEIYRDAIKCSRGCADGACQNYANSQCEVSGTDYDIGTRFSSLNKFCNRNGDLQPFRANGLSCSYSYECTSNSCVNGTCKSSDAVTNPVCGNGILESGEECDDRDSNGICPATCSDVCDYNSCEGGGGDNGGENQDNFGGNNSGGNQEHSTTSNSVFWTIFFILLILSIIVLVVIWFVYKNKKIGSEPGRRLKIIPRNIPPGSPSTGFSPRPIGPGNILPFSSRPNGSRNI